MNRLSQIEHRLWERAKWGAPPVLENSLLPRLYEFKELVLPIVEPELAVREWRGQGKGSPLTVTWVGLNYARPYLKSAMFAEEPEEIERPPISAWHPDQVANFPNSDIVVVAGSERFVRRLPRRQAIIMPLFVNHILDIRGDWQDVKTRLRRSKGARKEFSWLERYDYTYEISHDDGDFEMYHSTMYLPTMRKRHGDAADPISKDEARLHFRQGFLLLLKRDGCLVAGSLCRPHGETVKGIALGIANADEQLLKENVTGALYISVIRWAHQAGFKAVDFLGVPPYPDMGVFQYKRKWGTAVNIPPTSHKQFWFGFQRDTPAVRQFLEDNPCVIADERNDLHVLIVVDDIDKITPEFEEQLCRHYFMPGLKGLLIRSATDLLMRPATDLPISQSAYSVYRRFPLAPAI